MRIAPRLLAPLALVATLILGCGNGSTNGKIAASGTVETVDVTISPSIAGIIMRMTVDEGSIIHTGDTIAVIDTTDYFLNASQAEAAGMMAEAQLRLLEAGSRPEDVNQAAAFVAQASAAVHSAAEDLRRLKGLESGKSVTPKQLDDAKSRYDAAVAAEQASKEVLSKLNHGARVEDVQAARARVEQAKAQTMLLRKKMHDCFVRAMIGGTVTHVAARRGETVGAGMPIITVSALDTVKVTIYVNDKQLGNVRLGQKASVRVDSKPDHPYGGMITYISPNAEFTPKNVQTKDDREKLVFAVKILVPNPDGALKPGMPADAELE
jgi:HlyD family secretion protein